jgi:chromosome segregation ATPase
LEATGIETRLADEVLKNEMFREEYEKKWNTLSRNTRADYARELHDHTTIKKVLAQQLNDPNPNAVNAPLLNLRDELAKTHARINKFQGIADVQGVAARFDEMNTSYKNLYDKSDAGFAARLAAEKRLDGRINVVQEANDRDILKLVDSVRESSEDTEKLREHMRGQESKITELERRLQHQSQQIQWLMDRQMGI